jgi:AraC-like DNA-binding protein
MLPLAYDWVEIVVVREGTGEATLCDGARRVPVVPASIAFLMPNTPFGLYPDGRMVVTKVFVSSHYLLSQVQYENPSLAFDLTSARLLSALMFPEPSQLIVVANDAMEDLCRCLDGLAEMTQRMSILKEFYAAEYCLIGALSSIMPLLRRQRGITVPGANTLSERPSLPCISRIHGLTASTRRALAWIGERYRDSWTIRDLAEAVSMSESAVKRTFARQLGKSPLALRDALRIRAMAKLIAEGGMSVKSAAATVGWAKPDIAVARFRSSVGMTPAQWRSEFSRHLGASATLPDRVIEPLNLVDFRA